MTSTSKLEVNRNSEKHIGATMLWDLWDASPTLKVMGTWLFGPQILAKD
jgi:hypothetical protein